jgi:hypothetical protein
LDLAPEKIRVKILLKSARGRESQNLLRRFPLKEPVWGNCQFILDYDERSYDWLVVYDDLPPIGGERFGLWKEELSCPRSRTLLITAEPSTIKCYGRGFVRQFGHILTSQEPWAMRHPGAIFSQPGLLWFYGRTDERGSYDQMVKHPPVEKTETISTVCSSKQQTHTLHQARFNFTQALRPLIPEMKVYGHGVRPITDKAEALDPYRYHIAIENHVCRHHWTEKLSDSFLGLCLPFYYGCPNAEDYFPEDSFIRIDIGQVEESAERIRKAIRDREYERRLPAIREARRRVLDHYGLFSVLSRIIEKNHQIPVHEKTTNGAVLCSRHALRRSSLTHSLSYGAEKIYFACRHRWLPNQMGKLF